jgi:dihydroorotase
MIVIAGGSVLTPAGMTRCDVIVTDGVVASLEPDADTKGATVLDASGSLVGPGLVDLHTHLRDPGQTWKEDLSTGSAAAAAGGFTAITAMPNTDPPLDDPKLLADVAARGRDIGLTGIGVAAAVTRGRAGQEVAALENLYEAGARLFTDDGDPVSSSSVLAEALRRLRRLPGAVLAQHAEDRTLFAGPADAAAAAEEDMVRRDLEVLREVGGRYHCQHVSSAGTVALLRRAHDEGLAVTAEATPHHLTFDDATADASEPNFKMYPPLRTPSDREALAGAVRDGVIDAVATDHAPHTDEEKGVGIEAAPAGVIGLETAASAVWETVGEPVRFFEVLALAPARIAGLSDQGLAVRPGVTANLVVFDPGARWVPREFVSRSRNSPYLGREMTGKVTATVYQGRITHEAPH